MENRKGKSITELLKSMKILFGMIMLGMGLLAGSHLSLAATAV